MPDPTLNLAFSALRIRVAEYLGLAYLGAAGDEAASLPTDAHDLDLVGRLVNDGYRRFLTDHEKGWNFLTVPLLVTFGTSLVASPDRSRYYLPDDFYGVLVQPFTYPANTSAGLTTIDPVPEFVLRELRATSNASGFPSVVALRAINTTATATGQRWEAIFWPPPTGTEVVTAVYKRFPAALSAATDRSVAGFVHDGSVLQAALAEAELQRNDRAGPREAAYQAALLRSKLIDARTTAPRGGGYGDPNAREGRGLGRINPSTLYNDISI